jgi:hypothetical protein
VAVQWLFCPAAIQKQHRPCRSHHPWYVCCLV